MISTDSFFEAPRSWSYLKYRVLDKYLSAYFPKVNQAFMKPAVAADLFAGRGKFDDGTDGSPIIIARHAKTWYEKLGYRNRVFLAELREEDREKLSENVKEFVDSGIVTIVPGDASSVGLWLLERIRPGIPLFIFLDPFGVKGLSMKLLLDVCKRAENQSTEVLINFNLRAISRLLGVCKKENDKSEINKKLAHSNIALLNDVLGGDWWKKLLVDEQLSDDERSELIFEKYVDIFEEHFAYTGSLPVSKGMPNEDVKYHLIFASRNQTAFELMNDVMKKAWYEFMLDIVKNQNVGGLFDQIDPAELIPTEFKTDSKELAQLVFNAAAEFCKDQKAYYESVEKVPMQRPTLRSFLLKKRFARFSTSEYNEAIGHLLKEGKFVSETNRTRISDSTLFRLAVGISID